MVGTLVVTLPSSYTGGELMVGHNEDWKGSKTALSLVAFYADCRHEVLKVNSGYRITLTYKLLLHGDTSRPDGDEGTAAELADLLREHFSTPVPRYYGGSRGRSAEPAGLPARPRVHAPRAELAAAVQRMLQGTDRIGRDTRPDPDAEVFPCAQKNGR